MATVTIGGKVLELPVLNLKTIKRIWPMVESVQESDDLLKLMDAASKVLSVALERTDSPMTPEEIEDQMLGPEMVGIQKSIEDLLVESGLLQRKEDGDVGPGEASGEAEDLSTEIGTASSESLSPPVAAEPTGS